VLRKQGPGNLIESKHGKVLELQGLRLGAGNGTYDAVLEAIGGRLILRECEVIGQYGNGVRVEAGCQVEVQGGTVLRGCDRYGLFANGARTHLVAAGVTNDDI
jgi:hypothetical protein